MIRFYQQLGKVFYTIAAVDNTVHKEEIDKLKKIIKTEWLPLEDSHDQFGSDSAFEIEIVFDWLVANNWEHTQTLSDFEFFIKEHKSLFTEQTKSLIIKTAEAIANSFAKKNKAEHVIISQLKMAFEQ